MLETSAGGSRPAATAEIELIGPPPGPHDAIVMLSGFAVVSANVEAGWVARHAPALRDGGPLHPEFIASLAELLTADVGTLNLLLAAPGTGGTQSGISGEGLDIDSRTAASEEQTLVGYGLAQRFELLPQSGSADGSVAVDADHAQRARAQLADGEWLFCPVSPGDVESLRSCLAAGFTPIGSEVLFLTRPSD